jgi:hypothetical protein
MTFATINICCDLEIQNRHSVLFYIWNHFWGSTPRLSMQSLQLFKKYWSCRRVSEWFTLMHTSICSVVQYQNLSSLFFNICIITSHSLFVHWSSFIIILTVDMVILIIYIKCIFKQNRHLWAGCLEDVGASMSHTSMGLHGLLQG